MTLLRGPLLGTRIKNPSLLIPQNVSKKEWTVGRKGIRSDGAEIIVSSISSINIHDQVQTNYDRNEIIKEDK